MTFDLINLYLLSFTNLIRSSYLRHYEALLKTSETLEKAQIGLEAATSADFIAIDIRQAMFHLGTITGDISTDDLLGNIFSKFCIGK